VRRPPFAPVALLLASLASGAHAADAAPPTDDVVKRANAQVDAALTDAKPNFRGEGFAALGASHRADAREKLLAALVDDDGHNRFAAAQGLRMLADPKTAPAIVAAWRKEKGWAIKKELSLAAGATGARDLVPDMKAALLYETASDVRETLAWSLDDLGDSDARSALAQMGNPERKKLIKDGADSWSRHVLEGKKQGDERLAVKTLAFMGTREDVPQLTRRLDSADAETRLWAAAALIRLTH
jgi:HEAT repeat protein